MQTYSTAVLARSQATLAGLARPDADTLNITGQVTRFTRDQEIFGDGEPADHLYKIIEGSVRAFRVLADGRRQICDFHLAGDIFGVETGAQHRTTAEAVGDCQIIVARYSALGIGPEQSRRIGQLAIAGLERAQDHVLTLGRRTAVERVAHFLLDLAERMGGVDSLELPMSRQDMADFLGLTIETVSRTLTQLREMGLIAFQGRRRIAFRRPAALAELCL